VAPVEEIAVVPEEEVEAPVKELVGTPDENDELERRLAAEEEIERRAVHEHHEAPHFKKEVD
jgi:hypothetical protein